MTTPAEATQVVPLSKAEAALRELWARSGALRSRLSTGTLVVVADREDRDEVEAALLGLHDRVPCRSIVVLLDKNAKLDGQGEVSVIHRAAGACERVILTTTIERAAASALPLVLADMPSRVWWRTKKAAPGATPSMQAFPGDTIIFDTEATGFQYLPLPRAAIDLNWMRLRPWRLALARAFEDPERSKLLTHIERVVLSGNASAGIGAGVQGWLLGSWLAGRLGWGEAKRPSGRLLSFTAPNGEVTVSWMTVTRPDLKPGRLARVELGFSGGAGITVEAQPESPFLVFDEQPRGLAWREPGVTESIDALLGEAFVSDPDGEWLKVVERAAGWNAQPPGLGEAGGA